MFIPSQHLKWFQSLSKKIGLDNAQQAIDAGGLLFGDVVVTFNPCLTVGAEDHLLLQSPLGRLPGGGEAILRRLLEVQLLMAGSSGPTFGIAPHSDLLVTSVVLKPKEISSEQAEDVLRGMIYLVRKLRSDLKMTPDSSSLSSARPRSAATAEGSMKW